jgi:SWI/SNF-related matrix-associated actin-dependent regulator of chromatin subfamily A3
VLLTFHDTAHKIRNRGTKQFEAVQHLPAQRRWCVTGTPIQNRLEDLGSLVAFLRTPLLEKAPTFRACIVAPASLDQFQNLQILLNTICLRRTREILGLPEPVAQLRLIRFSEDERHRYNELYGYYQRNIQIAVSGFAQYASTTLQSIHELRLFCNNGPRTIQKDSHESDDEKLSYLQQLDENACAKCSLPIFCIDQAGDGNRGLFIPTCRHLVCHSCYIQCVDKKNACLLCKKFGPPTLPEDTSTILPTQMTDEPTLQYPSKLLALLQDIKTDRGHKW